MKNLSLSAKKITFSLVAAIFALGFSAFKIESHKLADGDFRFYNKSTTIQNPTHSQYVYQSSTSLCDVNGPVCSEVWNIGTTTTPPNGRLLSFYTSPDYVGAPNTGTYNGD